jgi:ketosteroid isomerase-like protein
MHTPLRYLAAMLVAGCASEPPSSIQTDVLELLDVSQHSNSALMRGDVDRYREIVTYSEDFTLFSPFGGEPTRGMTPERFARMGKFFKNGVFKQEVVSTYHVDDMVVLALIEKPYVSVAGLPEQEWALRVTLVYRKDNGKWRLVHRHADPLVHGITHAHAAEHALGIAEGNGEGAVK